VEFRELGVRHSYEVTPKLFADDRGLFTEWFRADHLEKHTGRSFATVQANLSRSRRGVVRGIHFASIPPSQAKFVTCVSGAVLDYVVDIRLGSPTFGMWDSVLLDDVDRRGIFIPEGLGHAFVALTDDAVVSYLVTAPFNAEREHGIDPTDASIGLAFPDDLGELKLSPKDTDAPSLAEAKELGLLPSYNAAVAYYSQLRTGA
jgi:dTDP-4-dehydrorhamnose 3,5-epimerase